MEIASRLFVPEGNAALRQIIRRHFDGDFVTRQNPNPVLAHAARRMRQDLMFVFKFNAEHGVGQQFRYNAGKFDRIFFGHESSSLLWQTAHTMGKRGGLVKVFGRIAQVSKRPVLCRLQAGPAFQWEALANSIIKLITDRAVCVQPGLSVPFNHGRIKGVPKLDLSGHGARQFNGPMLRFR